MTNTVGQVQTNLETPHPALSKQDLGQRSLGHGCFEEAQKGQAGMQDSTGERCWSDILGQNHGPAHVSLTPTPGSLTHPWIYLSCPNWLLQALKVSSLPHSPPHADPSSSPEMLCCCPLVFSASANRLL